MDKVLITGASGYLAKTLVPLVAQRANVVATARSILSIPAQAKPVALDIADVDAVSKVVLSEKPDAIIHCAACNPGGDESNMFTVNAEGAAHVAHAARQLGCRLVAVSSDTVFNGRDAPFFDNAIASPLPGNIYAQSKARADALMLSLLPDALVVRTSLIYGFQQMDRGTQSFISHLEMGNDLHLFTDAIRQPVYVESLAASLCALAVDYPHESGTINVAGQEAISRHDFGIRMLDHWGIDYAGKLFPVSGRDVPGLPLDLRLDLQRATTLGLSLSGVSAVFDTL